MDEWKKIVMEVCDKPKDGDPVQFVSMHILQWERLKRDYSIKEPNLRLTYEREAE